MPKFVIDNFREFKLIEKHLYDLIIITFCVDLQQGDMINLMLLL